MAAEKPVVITDDAAPQGLEAEPIKEEIKKVEQYIRFNSGDSLEALAKKYETTVEVIIERNKLNPAALQVGHWLYV